MFSTALSIGQQGTNEFTKSHFWCNFVLFRSENIFFFDFVRTVKKKGWYPISFLGYRSAFIQTFQNKNFQNFMVELRAFVLRKPFKIVSKLNFKIKTTNKRKKSSIWAENHLFGAMISKRLPSFASQFWVMFCRKYESAEAFLRWRVTGIPRKHRYCMLSPRKSQYSRTADSMR